MVVQYAQVQADAFCGASLSHRLVSREERTMLILEVQRDGVSPKRPSALRGVRAVVSSPPVFGFQGPHRATPRSGVNSRALNTYRRHSSSHLLSPHTLLAATLTCTPSRQNGICQHSPHTAQGRVIRCSRDRHRRAVWAGAAWAGSAEGRPCCLCAN